MKSFVLKNNLGCKALIFALFLLMLMPAITSPARGATTAVEVDPLFRDFYSETEYVRRRRRCMEIVKARET